MLKSNLRVLMAEKEIDTVKELMDKSGLSRNAINKVYHKDNMETAKLKTFLSLCNALSCELSDLIEYKP